MPKGYIIARVDISDPEQYSKYTALTPAAVAEAGGKFIVRGGRQEALEGEEGRARTVVLEWPSYDAAKAFYESETYSEIKKLRQPASEADFLLVEGHDG